MSKAPALTIPTAWRLDDQAMHARDLDRLSSELHRFSKEAGRAYALIPEISPIKTKGQTAGGFDAVARAGPRDGETVEVVMPKPIPQNGGREVRIIRTTTTGTVLVYGNGANVNGVSRVMLLATLGLTTFLFDGQNYYTASAALPWDENL